MATAVPGAATSDAAAVKFFNITELLEQMLLRADRKTLLLFQAVSTRFKHVIEQSHMLQKKLFLRPVESFEEAQALGFAEENGIFTAMTTVSGGEDTFRYPAFINTNLVKATSTASSDSSRGETCFELKEAIIESATEARVGDRGSWERMMFTQPATHVIRQLQIRKGGADHGPFSTKNPFIVTNNIPFTLGIYLQKHKKMGELIDGALKAVRKHHQWMLDSELHWFMASGATFDITPFCVQGSEGQVQPSEGRARFPSVRKIDDEGRYQVRPQIRGD